MHRYQVAKYVIFDTEKIFVKKFPWMLKYNFFKHPRKLFDNLRKILQKLKNSKILKCGCRKNYVCISCEK
jgi:hypothetical protein